MTVRSFDDVTDEELLGAFTAGGNERDRAFMALVDRYERRVYGICYRYFGDHADAQDATQETFLTVLRRAGSFRGDSQLSTWMYRVTVNTCNDLARKRARRPQTPVADVGELAGAAVVADDEIAGRELALHVQHALSQLDDLSRTLIILISIEGQGYAEVSEALDLPVGTIKSRVHRARARLAELLADHLPGEGDGAGPRTVTRHDGVQNRTSGGPARPRGPPD